MYKGIKIFLLLLLFGNTLAQNDIDFHAKELVRALRKTGNQEISGFSEIPVPALFSKHDTPNGKFFVNRIEDSGVKYIYVGRVYTCRADGCTLQPDIKGGMSAEYFDYFMFFDESLKIILVRIFSYEASHGHEITARGWLRQFENYDGLKSLEVGKNIDAVTGATISVYGMTHDVQSKADMLRKLLN
jgi:hypothetical protein